MKNPRKNLDSAEGIFPMVQLSNIITRWHHQTVIKEREIRVEIFYHRAVKYINDSIESFIGKNE